MTPATDLTRPGDASVAARSDRVVGGGRVPRRAEIATELVRDNREYVALRKVAELLGSLPHKGPLSTDQNERIVAAARRAALDEVLREHRDHDALDVDLDRAGEDREVDEC